MVERNNPTDLAWEISRRDLVALLAAGGLIFGLNLVKFLSELTAREAEQSKGDLSKIREAEDLSKSTVAATAEVDELPKNRTEVEIGKIDTGVKLLESLNLEGRVIYLVYGRPNRGWGSLGQTMTAEESWNLAKRRQAETSIAIGKPTQHFAYTIVNAVYFNDNRGSYPIKDIYVEKALELAPLNNGLVALDFSNIDKAKETILKFESNFLLERMAYLAVSLDVEHFPSKTLEAQKINDFMIWFSQKHNEWLSKTNIGVPAFVFVYTFGGGKILNLEQLKQYYLNEKALVIPIFDGYGSDDAKLKAMSGYIKTLPNTPSNPALLGVMEFQSRWGNKYDIVPLQLTYNTLMGAPVFVFASQ